MTNPAEELKSNDFNFKCPKCGSVYFGTVNPFEQDHGKRLVECHGDSSSGPRRCDYVGKYSEFEKSAEER